MPLSQQRRSLKNLYEEDDSSSSISDSSASSDMDMNHMSAPNLYFRDSSYKNSLLITPTKIHSSVGSRKSFRKAIGAAKEQLQTNPPVSPMAVLENMRKSIKKTSKSPRNVFLRKESSPKTSWRDNLDLPANTTKEQAFAVLLCRELETIDI
jgi:hypothetical protein